LGPGSPPPGPLKKTRFIEVRYFANAHVVERRICSCLEIVCYDVMLTAKLSTIKRSAS
jgi:hypothetical protein